MLSCTEFIPAYSALFTFLEEQYGPREVPRYWGLHFDPSKSMLYRFVSKEGLKGCYSYWSGTLREEAADFTLYLDETQGFFLLDMHHCPSKGRLLKLKEEIGVEPYHGYCLHCDHYRAAIEACGLKYLFNCVDNAKAACSILVYDPVIFSGRVTVGPETQILDCRTSDHEYFHKAFHASLNKGITYLAEMYGEANVREYLTGFTKAVYRPVAEDARRRGLAAIEDKILDTYQKEHAPDAVKTVLEGGTLTVTVAYCPAEHYMRSNGIAVSPYYYLTTETVMDTLAQMSGFTFHMDHYDPAAGAAKYRFTE